jgi:hypothetical protein
MGARERKGTSGRRVSGAPGAFWFLPVVPGRRAQLAFGVGSKMVSGGFSPDIAMLACQSSLALS